MQVKKQQLELNVEQRTGSKLGKEYIKAVYSHPAYLTYMQNKVKLVAQSCPTLCDPIDGSPEGLGVNKAEVGDFLELSCFFNDPMDVDNLISGSSTFSKCSLNIWKFLVHVLLKLCLENFEHYFASI